MSGGRALVHRDWLEAVDHASAAMKLAADKIDELRAENEKLKAQLAEANAALDEWRSGARSLPRWDVTP